MITTNEAYREIEDEPISTTAGDDVKVEEKAETETKKEEATAPEVKEEVKDDTAASPKTDADGDKTEKKQFTSQEKINFSFSKLKKKHAAEVEALNKKIAEQQKIIEEFNNKGRDQYKSDDEYLDAKLDAREAQRELNRSRQESLALVERQQSEAMRERVTKLYPSEGLQKVYAEACEQGQRNGALQAMMSDEVIKKYIFESDKSPLLVEAFCRKPELLQKILDTSDNRKPLACYDLEQRLSRMVEEAEAKARTQSQPNTQTTQATSAIPVVGKVANAGVNKSAPSDDWADEKELFKFARS